MNDTYKIMIVDDEFEIREGLNSYYWERFQFQVIGCAANGKQALDLLQRNDVDVVLTDIKMPVMDGIELSREINIHYPHVKIVILSGYKEFTYARDALQAGVSEYLLKPVDLKHLNESIMKLKLQLDADRQSSQKLQSYENQLAGSLPAARDHFFQSLIEDALPEYHEAKEKMSLLEIEMNATYYCCAALKLETQANPDSHLPNANLMTKAHTILERHLDAGQCQSYTLRKKAGELAVFLNLNATSVPPRRSLSLILEQILSSIEQETGSRSIIGLGEVYPSILSFPDSYKQARSIMERNIFWERGGLFLWDQADGHPVERKTYPYLYETKLLDAVLEGNQDNSLLQFQQFWNSCGLESERAELPIVLRYLLPLFTMLERRLDLHGASFESMASLHMPFTEFIERFPTLSQLKMALDRLLSDISLQIKQINDDVQTTSHSAVQQVKKYIDEHYSEKITLNQMAELVYLNPSYFSIQFKKETGINFIDYLKNCRMEKAKELLRRIDLKVYEIGELVGYQDRKYFATTFKSHTKLTPLEYRQSFITY
ncbi:response regulator [Paenibacillus sp. HWE-109]|uniref:response regulator n=1 Tax=Paenibacillus sp. HWE-109 TaxID=1306526 RepID=UPI001EDD3528|nr:response regulator [Paenibacillus sp. HWE-109]UKS28350.1 response regulator [Paenibacillus sp. HWE-109]